MAGLLIFVEIRLIDGQKLLEPECSNCGVCASTRHTVSNVSTKMARLRILKPQE
jgi:hypothetical protein